MYDDEEPFSLADIITNDQPATPAPDQQHHTHNHHTQLQLQQQQQDLINPDDQEVPNFFVRALYDYQSTDASSLSFTRGALIEVLTQLESGWWDGLLGEERGWFPSNYVEVLSEEEAEAVLAAIDAANAAAAANPNTTADPAHTEHGEWNDDVSRYPSVAETGATGEPARAEDFWMPQVTGAGQVFFLNTRTGERASEIPTFPSDPRETEFASSPQQLQAPQSIHQPSAQSPSTITRTTRTRSDTYDTTASSMSGTAPTSIASSSTILTPTPGSAGFGSSNKEDEVPFPWVKRTVGEGLAYFYMNQETGQIRWSAPSPVMGGGRQKLPPLLDTDESDWSAPDAYVSSQGGLTADMPQEMRRLSVYSDDSDVRPLDPPANHSVSSGSPNRTSLTSNPDYGEHENTSQPTSTASMKNQDGPSGETLARQLQMMLAPPAIDRIETLSNTVRDAIAAVVEAVGASPQPGEMALRVAHVVTTVRNLLYVSGALSTPISNIHLSRQYAGSPTGQSYVEEAMHESGRAAPLLELKPFQRKVTATLSKLVLSARAADSNPDWPYDDASTRVDSDAGELERAVVSFVMEVNRLEVLGGVVLAEKRLEGALMSGEGLAGIGTNIYGAGVGGNWMGMGFVPPADGDEERVLPQWTLGKEVLAEMMTFKAVLDLALDALIERDSPIDVETLIPRVRHALSNLSAFLALAEDIDIARNLDVDGILYPSPHPLDPKVVEEYTNLIDTARRLIRKLEVDKQAIYDQGASIWANAQLIFVDPAATNANSLAGLHLDNQDTPVVLLRMSTEGVREATVDTMDCYRALYDVALQQEEAHRRGLRASIGFRDGAISPTQRQRLSSAGMLHPQDEMMLSSDHLHEMMMGGSSGLDFDEDDADDAVLGMEGDDEDMVDVGFALRSRQVKTHHQQQHQQQQPAAQLQPPVVPLSASRSASPLKNGHANGAGSASGSRAHLSSTSTLLNRENDRDGDGASTIRQSTDASNAEAELELDEEFELELETGYGGRPRPRRRGTDGKAPNKLDKITQLLGAGALPAHFVATQTAQQQPWYLRSDHDPKTILINPDGGVRGGTLEALVERLTLHNYRDAVYNDTFLITFKSFTTVDGLFDLLVNRFNIPEPEGLRPDERKDWIEKKQTPIRFRVINILRSMLVESHVLEKEDMHILRRINDFATAVSDTVPPAMQLKALVERTLSGEMRITKPTTTTSPPAPLLPKNPRSVKLLDVDPLEMARQLTIMESKLYLKIRSMECLARAKEQQGEDDSIKKIIGVSNKIASWVAQQVLSKDDPRRRAAIIKQFVLIAERCRELNNFSSMAALIAGLNSPPIRRLKRTWELLNTRVTATLDDVELTLDSGRNFTGYRALLATVNPPCIPFLGVYLTTLTFIQDGNKDMLVKEGNLINFNKRQKAAEVIREIKKYQSRPYNLHEIPSVQELIEKSLLGLENAPDFWELSMLLEPRERDDEKMARLLQESGFL